MTQTEWLGCNDSVPMVNFLEGKMSERKLRLFTCACCRRVEHLLRYPRSKRALQIAEQFAEGAVSAEERQRASRSAKSALYAFRVPHNGMSRAADAVCSALQQSALHAARDTPGTVAGAVADNAVWKNFPPRCQDARDQAFSAAWHKAAAAEMSELIVLLRDIVGDPWGAVSIKPSWLHWKDGCVGKIAQTIYEEQAFERLPILADALEEAGCDDADILTHCRSAGRHVLGCWVLDLLLGKS